jgi:PST family polysaccharide transporter
MSLGKQATTGAIWNYAAFVVSKSFLLVATFILARLLSTEEIGLMSMALLVILIFDLLRDFGSGPALIYRQKDGKAAADVAFVISASLGLGLFVLNWLLAPLVVGFFDKASDPALLTSLLQVLGFSLLFTALGSTQDALLQKDINYRRRMIPEVGRTLVKGGLQVGLALTGFGVWSLVIGQVAGEATGTILLWVMSRWRPTFRLDWALFRPMMRYGAQIMMVDALGTAVANIDYIIIGRLLGEAPLALYTYAFRIPELTIKNMAQAVSTAAFPVAARLQDDLAALRNAYLRMQHYMLVILAPLGLGLFAVTPALIHLLLPARWWPLIPAMMLLSIYMVLGGINHWPGVIYKAVGRPDILNALSFVKLVLLLPALWWGAVNYGIEGVAWGQVIVRTVGILIDMWVVSRFVHVPVRDNLRVLWPPLAAAVIMAAAVRGVFLALDPPETNALVLALAVVVGAAIYAAVIWLLDRNTVGALLDLARSLLRRSRPAPVAEV